LSLCSNNNNNNWKIIIRITNGTTPIDDGKEDTILLSKKQLTNASPVSQDFIPYHEPIESSILEVRDIALGPQYLVVGAQWNSISEDVTTIPVKVIAQEKIHTDAGTFDTYILSYTIGSKTTEFG
jgi:hypothetical protein